VPRVDLAIAEHDLFARTGGGRDLALGVPIERRCEERHLVALRVVGDVGERVARHDVRELVSRPDEHGDLEPESACDRSLARPRDLLRQCVPREHDVPALEVGLHVGEAGVGEQLAQLRHRDAVARGEIDPAQ
jgi:hypothetical protein